MFSWSMVSCLDSWSRDATSTVARNGKLRQSGWCAGWNDWIQVHSAIPKVGRPIDRTHAGNPNMRIFRLGNATAVHLYHLLDF